jgi:hypothetical protein
VPASSMLRRLNLLLVRFGLSPLSRLDISHSYSNGKSHPLLFRMEAGGVFF